MLNMKNKESSYLQREDTVVELREKGHIIMT